MGKINRENVMFRNFFKNCHRRASWNIEIPRVGKSQFVICYSSYTGNLFEDNSFFYHRRLECSLFFFQKGIFKWMTCLGTRVIDIFLKCFLKKSLINQKNYCWNQTLFPHINIFFYFRIINFFPPARKDQHLLYKYKSNRNIVCSLESECFFNKE